MISSGSTPPHSLTYAVSSRWCSYTTALVRASHVGKVPRYTIVRSGTGDGDAESSAGEAAGDANGQGDDGEGGVEGNGDHAEGGEEGEIDAGDGERDTESMVLEGEEGGVEYHRVWKLDHPSALQVVARGYLVFKETNIDLWFFSKRKRTKETEKIKRRTLRCKNPASRQ